jgi:hypothetical protein
MRGRPDGLPGRGQLNFTFLQWVPRGHLHPLQCSTRALLYGSMSTRQQCNSPRHVFGKTIWSIFLRGNRCSIDDIDDLFKKNRWRFCPVTQKKQMLSVMISSRYVQIVNDGTEGLMAGHHRDSFGLKVICNQSMKWQSNSTHMDLYEHREERTHSVRNIGALIVCGPLVTVLSGFTCKIAPWTKDIVTFEIATTVQQWAVKSNWLREGCWNRRFGSKTVVYSINSEWEM